MKPGVGRSTNEKEELLSNVALQIRLLRQRQNFSQQELADASGLSRNTLSLLERGLTSPTVTTLQKIAEVLQIEISDFFPSTSHQRAVHYESRKGLTVRFPMNDSSRGGACRIDRLISARILHLDSGASSGSLLSHDGEELVYCLSGKCLYSVDEKDYPLDPGDSLLFDGSLPHSCQNPGQIPAEALVILLDIIH